MSIYFRKQLWKVLLGFIAFMIVGASFTYTNHIVKSISEEERNKALLWAQAIREKAELVKYTNELFEKIEKEERKKGELWASGMKRLTSLRGNEDVSFVFEVIKNNETVPVILTDESGNIISSRNLDPSKSKNEKFLKKELAKMAKMYPPIEINILNKTKNYLYYKDSKLFSELKQVLDELISSFISEVVLNSASVPVVYVDSSFNEVIAYGNIQSSRGDSLSDQSLKEEMKRMMVHNDPIPVELSDGVVNYIVYADSYLLTKLKYYPYVQISVIGLFVVFGYIMFSISRRSEQDQVWVGMSKETAHQLGTPLSSLLAWVELLKLKYENEEAITEMQRDISRLETITDRFSKIGSKPKLEECDVKEVLTRSVGYLQSRLSRMVSFEIKSESNVKAMISVPLFEWVVENITKNAVDAMEGKGAIVYVVENKGGKVHIDIKDTGKGLPKSKFKSIFKPGFTTKKRGWGLGLTLVKRIVENYHKGKVFVKHSSLGNGTTFRISLNVSRSK